MCVRYNGEVSTFKSCPGGGPQGGLLTGVLFILQINKGGAPCTAPRMEEREVIHTQLEEEEDAAPRMEEREVIHTQ